MTNLFDEKVLTQVNRQRSWPIKDIAYKQQAMPVPFAFKVVGKVLELSKVVPGLSTHLGYKLFFRIKKTARKYHSKPVKDLEPQIHWISLSTYGGAESKQVCCYRFGDSKNPTVVLIHGWESRAEYMMAIVKELIAKNFYIILFDLPAHGASEGADTDLLEINAIVIALLRGDKQASVGQKVEDTPLSCEAIIAHSFGGVCATKLLSDGLQCNSLVLLSTPATFEGVFDKFSYLLNLSFRLQKRLKKKINDRFHFETDDVWQAFSTKANLKKLQQHVLIVHDHSDSIVPINEGQMLFDVATSRELRDKSTQALISEGFGHNRLLSSPNIASSIVDFIAEQSNSCKHNSVGEIK